MNETIKDSNNHSENRRALYVGRFQLFHLGHLDVVKYIASQPDVDEIVFAIGSSQFDYTNKSPKWPWANNPFTFDERKEMVQKSLEGEINKTYTMHPVPDYFNYPKWYQHIVDNLPKFEYLYTSDKKEKEFFENKGHIVRDFPKVREFHAQILRERMYKGVEYKSALAKGTIEVIDKINGEERIKDLFAKDFVLNLRGIK
jgi:nicotinamide-nucleotide adenylyltransferase